MICVSAVSERLTLSSESPTNPSIATPGRHQIGDTMARSVKGVPLAGRRDPLPDVPAFDVPLPRERSPRLLLPKTSSMLVEPMHG